MTWISPIPNTDKLPPWPFTLSRQPRRLVPTSPFMGPQERFWDRKPRWETSFGERWKLALYDDRIEIRNQYDYDWEEDHNQGFAVDLDGGPIIVDGYHHEGRTTLPPAKKFTRRVGRHLVQKIFSLNYSFIWLPTNPPSWHGGVYPGADEDYWIDGSGKRTENYIGPYQAHKWWGFSRSGYDHSHCHFNFGRFFRITWLEHGNYQHWQGSPEQQEWYWEAVLELRKSQPIRSAIRKQWWRFQHWLFR